MLECLSGEALAHGSTSQDVRGSLLQEYPKPLDAAFQPFSWLL